MFLNRTAMAALALFAAAAMACGAPAPAPDPEPAEPAAPPQEDVGGVLRIDPRLDAIVPPDARIEKLAEGFVFSEGPVWDRRASRLLFSDVRSNQVYEWTEAGGAQTYIDPVYTGDLAGLRSYSSNGLTIDAEGRLILCEHGNRVISRLEPDGTRTSLVGEYEGRRLNGPNDATFASDGSLYFTDPGSGLEGRDESPLRELDYNGIYRLSPDGELELLVRDHPRPNGIALSPDESILYVANSAADDIRWMAYDLGADGVSSARVFFAIDDAQGASGVADGMKVDVAGNVYATGPGGVWVISPDGEHLGTIMTGEVTANVAWGDDGRTLYMTASTGLYRVRLTAEGAIP